jgi:uncharacterized protein (TIGR03083 family)
MQTYRKFVQTDAVEMWARVDAAHQRFADLVSSVDPELRAHRSEWTARDVTGHVLTVLHRYSRTVEESRTRLGDSPRGVDELNAIELAALGEMTRDEMLAQFAEHLAVYETAIPAHLATDLTPTGRFHSGLFIDRAAGLANLLAEFLIHGRDVAVAAERPWPIAARDAALILNGNMQMIPAYSNHKSGAVLRVRLRTPGAEPWLLDFDRGTLTSRPLESTDRPDVVLRAPAEALALMLYSRLSPGAALRAGIVPIGGRRPWRVSELANVMHSS